MDGAEWHWHGNRKHSIKTNHWSHDVSISRAWLNSYFVRFIREWAGVMPAQLEGLTSSCEMTSFCVIIPRCLGSQETESDTLASKSGLTHSHQCDVRGQLTSSLRAVPGYVRRGYDNNLPVLTSQWDTIFPYIKHRAQHLPRSKTSDDVLFLILLLKSIHIQCNQFFFQVRF